jgi:hypothetical protein
MWSGRTAPGYRLPLAATRRVARLNARERPLLHSSFVQIICTNTPLASGRRDGRKGPDMAIDNLTLCRRKNILVTAENMARVEAIRGGASELRNRAYARFLATDRGESAMTRWNWWTTRICAREDAHLQALVTDFHGRYVSIGRNRRDIPVGRYMIVHEAHEAYSLCPIGGGRSIATGSLELCTLHADGEMAPLDPDIVARERQLLQLRAAAPLRPMGDVGRHSAGTVGLPLFEPCLL